MSKFISFGEKELYMELIMGYIVLMLNVVVVTKDMIAIALNILGFMALGAFITSNVYKRLKTK